MHQLDDYLEEIGFRETLFRVDRNTIDPASIVVLDPLPHASEIEGFVKALRTPVYRYIWSQQRPEATSKDLVIIPAFAQSMKADEKTALFKQAELILSQKAGVEVVTFSMYTQRFLKNLQAPKFVLEVSNRFQEHPTDDKHGPRGEPENAPVRSAAPLSESEGEWIENHAKANRRRQQFERIERMSRTRCNYGKYCQAGNACKRGHSKEDHLFFQVQGGPRKLNKTRLCDNPHCMKGIRCHYAHGEEDLFCPTCEGKGHRIGECVRRARGQN